MDLLVVGGSGFLGLEITRQARRAGQSVAATFHRRVPAVADVDWRNLDIRHHDDVTALVGAARPDVIVNAAYRQSDWATTAEGGMHVALAAAVVGARLVHVSSDAVFSGTAARYDETHVPDPTTPYGAAKAAAETAIKGITPTAVIARTSLIIGDGDSPQERHVHALAGGAVTGALFTDDVRCPVHVTDLACALLELAASPYCGIHHVAGTDAISSHAGTVSTKPPFLPGYAPAPASPDPSTCGWTAPTPKRGCTPAYEAHASSSHPRRPDQAGPRQQRTL